MPYILYGGSMVTAALVFLLYLGYLFVLRLVNSLRFLSLNLILNRDCDPVKLVLHLPPPTLPRRCQR